MENIKEILLEKTKDEIKKDLTSADQKIITFALILEKIPNNINELYEQLRIITDQIYPTLANYLDVENYCNFILTKDISNIKYNKKYSKEIKEIINEDIGLKTNDFENSFVINKLCENILELIKYEKRLEKYCQELLKENYYNFYKIATTKIAIKMLIIAGSFERLSHMPSSTIQLLGSEKSFFSALRKNRNTPKYGCIYNHKYMKDLSNKNKARFARLLASKISIALKADINKNNISEMLEEKLKNKIENLKN
jgi:RNA processing factor Prp31